MSRLFSRKMPMPDVTLHGTQQSIGRPDQEQIERDIERLQTMLARAKREDPRGKSEVRAGQKQTQKEDAKSHQEHLQNQESCTQDVLEGSTSGLALDIVRLNRLIQKREQEHEEEDRKMRRMMKTIKTTLENTVSELEGDAKSSTKQPKTMISLHRLSEEAPAIHGNASGFSKTSSPEPAAPPARALSPARYGVMENVSTQMSALGRVSLRSPTRDPPKSSRTNPQARGRHLQALEVSFPPLDLPLNATSLQEQKSQQTSCAYLRYVANDEEGRKCYIGQLRNGWRHGFGVLEWVDGSTYAGSWRNDHPDGYGIEIFADGSKYTGSFRKDFRDGYGEFELNTGVSYCAHFENGEMHGEMYIKEVDSFGTIQEVSARAEHGRVFREPDWNSLSVHDPRKKIAASAQKVMNALKIKVSESAALAANAAHKAHDLALQFSQDVAPVSEHAYRPDQPSISVENGTAASTAKLSGKDTVVREPESLTGSRLELTPATLPSNLPSVFSTFATTVHTARGRNLNNKQQPKSLDVQQFISALGRLQLLPQRCSTTMAMEIFAKAKKRSSVDQRMDQSAFEWSISFLSQKVQECTVTLQNVPAPSASKLPPVTGALSSSMSFDADDRIKTDTLSQQPSANKKQHSPIRAAGEGDDQNLTIPKDVVQHALGAIGQKTASSLATDADIEVPAYAEADKQGETNTMRRAEEDLLIEQQRTVRANVSKGHVAVQDALRSLSQGDICEARRARDFAAKIYVEAGDFSNWDSTPTGRSSKIAALSRAIALTESRLAVSQLDHEIAKGKRAAISADDAAEVASRALEQVETTTNRLQVQRMFERERLVEEEAKMQNRRVNEVAGNVAMASVKDQLALHEAMAARAAWQAATQFFKRAGKEVLDTKQAALSELENAISEAELLQKKQSEHLAHSLAGDSALKVAFEKLSKMDIVGANAASSSASSFYSMAGAYGEGQGAELARLDALILDAACQRQKEIDERRRKHEAEDNARMQAADRAEKEAEIWKIRVREERENIETVRAKAIAALECTSTEKRKELAAAEARMREELQQARRALELLEIAKEEARVSLERIRIEEETIMQKRQEEEESSEKQAEQALAAPIKTPTIEAAIPKAVASIEELDGQVSSEAKPRLWASASASASVSMLEGLNKHSCVEEMLEQQQLTCENSQNEKAGQTATLLVNQQDIMMMHDKSRTIEDFEGDESPSAFKVEKIISEVRRDEHGPVGLENEYLSHYQAAESPKNKSEPEVRSKVHDHTQIQHTATSKMVESKCEPARVNETKAKEHVTTVHANNEVLEIVQNDQESSAKKKIENFKNAIDGAQFELPEMSSEMTWIQNEDVGTKMDDKYGREQRELSEMTTHIASFHGDGTQTAHTTERHDALRAITQIQPQASLFLDSQEQANLIPKQKLNSKIKNESKRDLKARRREELEQITHPKGANSKIIIAIRFENEYSQKQVHIEAQELRKREDAILNDPSKIGSEEHSLTKVWRDTEHRQHERRAEPPTEEKGIAQSKTQNAIFVSSTKDDLSGKGIMTLEDAFDHARGTMCSFSASSIDTVLSAADTFPSIKMQVRPVKPQSRKLQQTVKNSPKSRQIKKSGIGASIQKHINNAIPADFDTRSPAWEKRLAYDSLIDGNCRIIMRNQSLKRMLSRTRPGDDYLLTRRMIIEASTTEAFHPLEGVSSSIGNDSGIKTGAESKIPRCFKHGIRGGMETWKSTVERLFEKRDIASDEASQVVNQTALSETCCSDSTTIQRDESKRLMQQTSNRDTLEEWAIKRFARLFPEETGRDNIEGRHSCRKPDTQRGSDIQLMSLETVMAADRSESCSALGKQLEKMWEELKIPEKEVAHVRRYSFAEPSATSLANLYYQVERVTKYRNHVKKTCELIYRREMLLLDLDQYSHDPEINLIGQLAALFASSQEVVQQISTLKSYYPGVDSRGCLLLDYIPKVRNDVARIKRLALSTSGSQISQQSTCTPGSDGQSNQSASNGEILQGQTPVIASQSTLQANVSDYLRFGGKLAAELVLESVQREAEESLMLSSAKSSVSYTRVLCQH